MSSDAGMSSDFGFHLSEIANTDSQRTNDDLLVPGHQIRVNPSPDFQGPTFPMPLPLSWDQFTGGICRNLAGGFDVPQNSWPPVDLGTAHVGGSVEWPASSSPNSDGDRDKSSKAQTFIISAARSILRADYLEYLAAELPRWAKWGLYNIDNCTVDPNAEYYDLQLAYSTVCLLYTRMGDDEIRSRISLVKLNKEYLRAFETWQSRRRKRGIGRGDATCIIDNILQNIYHDWPTRNDRERKDLRTQFHSRKHFGKRWTMLSDVLGKGILLLCSPKVAKMV
ncbi:Aurovertin biosynthesis cluster transcription factor aurF [Metarhizium brunneum]|uniref:Aurovertin biosynthesis cluster transcription factor aurF n=1 Tax=Metarhizium brunneum TaxID=500148 RepID=A0A7D5V406_9HYPO